MIADKRLIALAKCCATDKTRPALTYVHVKGDMAEATDGCILARTQFNTFKDEDFPDTPGEPSNGDDVFITPEQIGKAFKNAPKKPGLPILSCVKISVDREKKKSVVVSTDINSHTAATGCNDQGPYPDTEGVVPDYSADDRAVVVGLGLEPLQTIVALLKSTDDPSPTVYLQVVAKENGIKFIIGNDYKGIIMPIRYEDETLDHINEKWDGTKNMATTNHELLNHYGEDFKRIFNEDLAEYLGPNGFRIRKFKELIPDEQGVQWRDQVHVSYGNHAKEVIECLINKVIPEEEAS